MVLGGKKAPPKKHPFFHLVFAFVCLTVLTRYIQHFLLLDHSLSHLSSFSQVYLTMGAAASIPATPVAELTKEQVAELVVSCGKPFEKYKAAFLKKGINGAKLASTNKAQMSSLLMDVGITDEAHKKLLLSKLALLSKSEIHNDKNTSDDFELR